MRRHRTTRRRPRMSIMELPYKTHHELSRILDPYGANDWKKLVSLMPMYTAEDVMMIETEGKKPGISYTLELLKDMDEREFNVDDLRDILKASGNEKALACLLEGLDDESLIHDGLKRKRYIRPPPELEEPSESHIMKRYKMKTEGMRPKEGKQISKTRLSLQPSRDSVLKTAGEALAMAQQIHQPSGVIGQCHPGTGTTGTLRMDHHIHQPSDSDPGTMEILTDNPIFETSRNIYLCNLSQETLRMEESIWQQPTGDTDLYNPHPPTKETPRMDHTTHQHGEDRNELHFPIEETIDSQKELHKRRHTENLPSENDECHYRNSDGHKTSLCCLSTLNKQRLPVEHEDDKQESVTTWSIALLGSGLKWIMSCDKLN